jgi:glycosyltransferase involved in cell wall biosynthesis
MISNPLVSVVIPTYNASGSIAHCLRALIAQSYPNLQIIVCDDGSSDDTVGVASAIDDPRIVVVRSELNRGPSAARNRGIRQAAGEIIFFTDGDVEATRDWVRNGLRYFVDDALVGIEGKVIYVSRGYSQQYSDRIIENLHGGEYMTANVAYRKAALARVGLFRETLRLFEDRDLALRLRPLGQIAFAEDAVVCHMKESYSVRSYMREANKVVSQLSFEELHQQRVLKRLGPIVRFSHLVTIMFPPLVLARLLTQRPTSKRDLLMFLLIYPRLVWERYGIWRWGVRHNRLVM